MHNSEILAHQEKYANCAKITQIIFGDPSIHEKLSNISLVQEIKSTAMNKMNLNIGIFKNKYQFLAFFDYSHFDIRIMTQAFVLNYQSSRSTEMLIEPSMEGFQLVVLEGCAFENWDKILKVTLFGKFGRSECSHYFFEIFEKRSSSKNMLIETFA